MIKALLLATALIATPAIAQTGTAAAVASAAPDPARLAEARIVVAKLMPPGVYRTVMGAAMGPVIDGMGASMKALPLRQLAQIGGLDEKQAAALDKIDVERVMAIYDPHWQERQQLTMRAMFDAMGGFFTTLEPELREAYARAFANSFTLDDLRQYDAFFSTPAGARFAGRYLTMATDPAIAAEMKSIMPRMVQEMPTFLTAAQKATASLPPARKVEDLSPSERAELAKALGVSEKQLKDPKGAS